MGKAFKSSPKTRQKWIYPYLRSGLPYQFEGARNFTLLSLKTECEERKERGDGKEERDRTVSQSEGDSDRTIPEGRIQGNQRADTVREMQQYLVEDCQEKKMPKNATEDCHRQGMCPPPFPSLLFYTAPIVPPISIQKTMFLCPLLLSLSRTFFFQSSDLYFLRIFSLTVLKILHGANFKVCSRSFEQISINDTI